jgi:predicted kinase
MAAMAQAPKAFMLHGFIGSGKTTLARQLEQRFGALRFTHDEWMRQLYGQDPPADDFQDHANRIHAVMEAMWTRCLDIGTSVILDFGFWSRLERHRVASLVTAHGGEPSLYRVSCSEAAARSRIQKRNIEMSDGLYIAPETFDVLKARFEALDPDEDRIECPSPEPS